MKKKNVSIFSVLAVIVLLISLLSASTFADDEEHTCSGKIKIQIGFEGDSIVAQCRRCKKYIYPQKVSLDLSDGAVFCEGEFSIQVKDTGWSEISTQEYVIIYEGDSETEYAMTTTAPTEIGDYVAYLTLPELWEMGPETVLISRTTPIHFSIQPHTWEYCADGFTLKADCSNCDVSVKAMLDGSTLQGTMSSMDADEICSSLIMEENWSCQNGILGYALIYDGIGIDDNGREVKYENSLYYPEYPGSYTAKLAVPTDTKNVTYSVSTASLPFYIAGIPVDFCEIKSYSSEQIASFTQPKTEDNTFLVGTASELLWCVYNQSEKMKIKLTNDIILNPILVEDEVTVSSGSTVIYKWRGFGFDCRFTGSIDGCGHIIYGIYMPESLADWSMGGLICAGNNVVIKNLTIENSYFTTGCAGVFIGDLEVTDEARFENCRSIHNLVVAEREAGGLIGWVQGSRSPVDNAKYVIENCVNDSSVTGNNAGGIIGNTPSTENNMSCPGKIYKCANYGNITGNNFAAGIIGSLTAWHHLHYEISYCLNAGCIKASSYASEILGNLKINSNGSAMVQDAIDISNNVSIGEIYFSSQNKYEIIGKIGANNYYQIGLLRLENNYYYSEDYAYPSELSNAPEATRLSRTQIKYGDVCKILGGHMEASYYSVVAAPTCLASGSKTLSCTICKNVLETVKLREHGHYLVNGVCLYCDESNPTTGNVLGASLFTSDSWIAISVIVAVLFALGVGVIVFKNKKKATRSVEQK